MQKLTNIYAAPIVIWLGHHKRLGSDVRSVKESMALLANINKGRLNAANHPYYFAAINIAS